MMALVPQNNFGERAPHFLLYQWHVSKWTMSTSRSQICLYNHRNCAEVKIERSSRASSSACGSKCNGKESSESRDKKKPGNKSGKKKLAKKSGKTKVAKKSGKKNGRRKKKRRRRPDRKSKHHVRDRIGPRYKGSKDEIM